MEGSRRLMSRQQSAITQHAVHPPAESRSRQIASASPRQPVQTPVCAVQPGRTLELRTSLGLMRAKQLLEQQAALQSSEAEEQTQLRNAASNRAQLKSARLQPLGVVEDELITSQLCLGIIPAREKPQRRPKSSSTPGVRFDLQDDIPEKTNKSKQRSHSAVLARTVDTKHLMKLLSVSKHTGFVPQGIVRTAPAQSPTKPLVPTQDKQQLMIKPLPPVVHHGELGMKIEVKGLRQLQYEQIKSEDTRQSTERSSPRNKLPPISSTQSPRQSVSTKERQEAKQLADGERPVQKENTGKASPRPAADGSANDSNKDKMRISIVSMGETKLVENTKTHQRKRKSSGRLSHGWSPPQSVAPVTGSAMNRASRLSASPRTKTSKKEEERQTESSLNPSNSMVLEVNVNEFLDDT